MCLLSTLSLAVISNCAGWTVETPLSLWHQCPSQAFHRILQDSQFLFGTSELIFFREASYFWFGEELGGLGSRSPADIIRIPKALSTKTHAANTTFSVPPRIFWWILLVVNPFKHKLIICLCWRCASYEHEFLKSVLARFELDFVTHTLIIELYIYFGLGMYFSSAL